MTQNAGRHPERVGRRLALQQGEAGFSLLELVVVVIVAAIVAGIAMPVVNVARFRTDTAVLELSSAMQAAQRTAVLRGHPVVVAFDVPSRRVRIHLDANGDNIVQGTESVRHLELTQGVVFSRGGADKLEFGEGPITFTRTQDGMPALTFRRNGSASEEGAVYITSGRGATTGAFPDESRAVEVSRATGRITCLRFSSSEWWEGC